MKPLYYISFILWVPFYALAAIFHIPVMIFGWMGDFFHDQVSCKIGSVIHKREHAEWMKKRENYR